MHTQSLLALHRSFLIKEDDVGEEDGMAVLNTNCVLSTLSVTSELKLGKWDSDKREWIESDKPHHTREWHGELQVRYNNTSVLLHSIEGDEKLKSFERKLILLRNTLRFFVKETLKRSKSKGDKETLYERRWLNDEELPSHYTGYVSYKIEPLGGGSLFVSDCSRAINIWLSVYRRNGEIVVPRESKRTLKQLDRLVEEIDVVLGKLKTLRKRYASGELHRQELDNALPSKTSSEKLGAA